MPRRHVLTTLLDNPHFLRTAPKPLLHAVIQHGPDADHEYLHEKAAEQLANLHALILTSNSLTRKGQAPNHTGAALQAHQHDTPIPWGALLNAARKDEDQGTRPHQRTKSPNSMELEHIFRGPGGDDVVLIATESPTWTQGPAGNRKLFGPNPEQPLMEIVREADHTIHLRATEQQSQPITIPLQDQALQPVRQTSLNRPENLFSHRFTENLIGDAIQHLRANWQDIRPHESLGRPTPDQILGAIRTALYSTQSRKTYITEQFRLAEEIDTAVRSLAHPNTTSAARRYAKHVTTFQYNAVITLGDSLTELARTNPGAVAWAMNHVTNSALVTETIRHPGQVITMAKESLQAAGLHPRNWKFAATLDHPIIRETPTGSSKALALFLNAMAAAGTAPPPYPAAFIMNSVLEPAYRKAITNTMNTKEIQELTADNITLFLTLLCRQHATGVPEGEALMDQALDAMDYVLHISERGEALRSTTWGGLLKASHQWHRDTRQAEILDEWERSNNGRKRKLLTWESLIGPTRKGDLEIRPLTSEYQLFQESREMNHCVVAYAHNCMDGDRIFSISRNGIKLATSQIRRTRQGWQEIQTRGRDNHHVSDIIRDAMREVATDYGRADQEALLASIEEDRAAE